MDWTTALALFALALPLALIGGAASGLKLGAEALGRELAALMGALFGPTAVLPAVLVGLVVLALAR